MRNLINTLMAEQTNRTVNGKIRNNMINHRSIKRETGMGVEGTIGLEGKYALYLKHR